jgi:hypothetical protein
LSYIDLKKPLILFISIFLKSIFVVKIDLIAEYFTEMRGYLYIRSRDDWKKDFDVCLLGHTGSLLDTHLFFKDMEIKLGWFDLVIEIYNKDAKIVERLVVEHFQKEGYWHYEGGGTGFFKCDIIPLIEEYLISKKIMYRILPKEEVDMLLQ